MTDHDTNSTISPEEAVHELNSALEKIRELEQDKEELQDALGQLTAERDRLVIENKLAIEDAEIARNFKRTDYAPLIEDLFGEPAKKLHRQVISIFILGMVLMVAGAYIIFGAFSTGAAISSPNTPEENTVIEETSVEEESQQATEEENTEASDQTENVEQEPAPVAEENTEEVSEVTPEPPTTDSALTPEAQDLIENINLLANDENLSNYSNNKTHWVNLYYQLIQQADFSFKHTTLLSTAGTLSLNPEWVNEESLIALDQQLLKAFYGAFWVIQKKNQQGWRFREEDQWLSSYSEMNDTFDLSQIKIGEGSDYTTLWAEFIAQWAPLLAHIENSHVNAPYQLPQNFIYLAYTEDNKNNFVRRLFSNEVLKQKDNLLQLDIAHEALNLAQDRIYQLQQQLADRGFIDPEIINGLAGPKTRAAILSYQDANEIEKNEVLNLQLFHSLNLFPTFRDLIIQP